MRNDDHHPSFNCTALCQKLKDFVATTGHPGGITEPNGANPLPARQ
jgi:hypothetical protein